MAMVLSYASTALHHRHPHLGLLGLSSRRICSLKPLKLTPIVRVRTPIRALSTTIVEIEPENASTEKVENSEKNILACPICYNQLKVESTTSSSFQCATCKKAYFNNGTYLDLTVSIGAKQYSEAKPVSTEVFRKPRPNNVLVFATLLINRPSRAIPSIGFCPVLHITPSVSFLYERGWRQNFVWGGFPGPDKEFEMAKKYLKPTLGGNIIDASCGSGLFSRRFAKSGLFSLVVALDFSENMLRQCSDFVTQEKSFPTENLTLVRADISRLPFVSSSVDAVHAGAALHCWPSPSAAVAEISRVLRPGGVLVATTFILDGFFPAIPFLRILRQNIGQVSVSSNIFLSERELEDLCKACGLVDFTCVRNGSFIMLSATKPR